MTDINIIGKAAAGVLILIALDIVAGITAAASNGEIDSSKLRHGLFHKVGQVLAFALSVALEYEEHVLPLGMDVPLVLPVSAYLILMEACSVYENIKSINPEFKFTSFEDLFKTIHDNDKEQQDNE